MPFAEMLHSLMSGIMVLFTLCIFFGKVGMGQNKIFARNNMHEIVVNNGKAKVETIKILRGLGITGIGLGDINDFIDMVLPQSVLI